MRKLSLQRIVVTVSGLLWLAHVGVGTALGTRAPGPLLSDLIQLALGLVLIVSVIEAGRRSEGMALSFWRLASTAYAVWLLAQGLSIYNHLARSPALGWTNNLLFSFWFVPLAMAMFLDPDYEAGNLDAL